MTITVTLAADGDLATWDKYVSAHPAGSVFLTSSWRSVVESTYGHESFYLMAKRGRSVAGVLPLFFLRSRVFGRVLATAPYGSWGGVCADGTADAHALIDAAITLGRRLDVHYVELKNLAGSCHPELSDYGRYVTYELSLADPEAMWSQRLKGRARTAVRKAQKFGLRCASGHELLDAFYDVMAASMRRLGTPVHSRVFYRNILAVFGERAAVLVAHHETTPVAGFLLLRQGPSVCHLAGGSRASEWHVNPNNFLMWEAIRFARAWGGESLDFGRSLAGSGQARFKEQWGGTVVPLHYEYSLQRSRSVPARDPSNRRYRPAIALWKRMPLAVTKALGPHLIRSVP